MDTDQDPLIDAIQTLVKWRGSSFSLPNINQNTSVGDIKRLLEGFTNVRFEKIKLIGLGKAVAGTIGDTTTVANLKFSLKAGIWQLSMMGTPEVEIVDMEIAAKSAQATVFNDFSLAFTSATREWTKLKEFTDKTSITFINEPRPGKKLLVLDLDHTILDFTSKDDSLTSDDMKRPYMDHFLTEVFPLYDLVIWSQTHW